MWKRTSTNPDADALNDFFSEDIDNLVTSTIARVCKSGHAMMIGTNRNRNAIMMKFYQEGEEPATIWCNSSAEFRDALIELHLFNYGETDPN